eukprot:CAMPEP_0185036098 /NCGR_PEP_ID=MMETSP1103-20130426/28558_1 /TAXON_ID=36769 /ORGANISM="Paraphysomonas bandaiensis, Strain Caron Lab Isolate" /LENGTH=189 /DNA_ID=CAMNT_0027573489 /DNA_START=62 /DNA_END=631 /DNA_ORIENTATION=+
MAHAIHCLPFFEFNPIMFKETACTIFCLQNENTAEDGNELATGMISKRGMQSVLRELLHARIHVFNVIDRLLPDQGALGFPEFESLLKLAVTCIRFSDTVQGFLNKYRHGQNESGTDDINEFHIYLQEQFASEELLDCKNEGNVRLERAAALQGVEVYKQKHPVVTPFWQKLYVTYSIEAFIERCINET